jgi:hypothetical protein
MEEITSSLQLKFWIKQLQIKINKPKFFMLKNRNPDFEISTKLKHIIINQTRGEQEIHIRPKSDITVERICLAVGFAWVTGGRSEKISYRWF